LVEPEAVRVAARPEASAAHPYRALIKLGWPLALTQLGQMFMGVTDTLMVARLSVDALAASALANMWQWGFLAIGMGTVMGIDAEVSQAHGRSDGEAAGRALQRGVVLALLVSVPICAAQAFTYEGLLLLGQPHAVALLAQQYNLVKLPTTPCFLLFIALKQYLQGRALVAPATWVMWIANILHLLGNWALIFGHLGMPALGFVGAAWASAVTTAFLPLGLFIATRAFRLHEGAWRPWDRASFALAPLLQTLRLGVPVGMQIALEAWAFAGASVMAGWISVANVSAHQIVLNMAALAFMVPLGLSMGTATRIGNLIGEGDVRAMRSAVRASLVLGGGVMGFSAVAFTVLRAELPRLFTDDAQLIALAAAILPLASAFQLADGLQVVAGGALRGMGRPNAAALINLVGYYAFALPVAYALAFHFELGLVGIWIALALGLFAVASGLVLWALHTAKKPLHELRVASAATASAAHYTGAT
jgi:MATE family multidrug resistance protein